MTPRPIHPSSPVSTASSAASTAASPRSDWERHREQERGQRRFPAPHFLHTAMTSFSPCLRTARTHGARSSFACTAPIRSSRLPPTPRHPRDAEAHATQRRRTPPRYVNTLHTGRSWDQTRSTRARRRPGRRNKPATSHDSTARGRGLLTARTAKGAGQRGDTTTEQRIRRDRGSRSARWDGRRAPDPGQFDDNAAGRAGRGSAAGCTGETRAQCHQRARQVVEAGVTRSMRANTTVSAACLSNPRSPLWRVTL